MYSDSLCRKLRGSLKMTGMVILDSSWRRQRESRGEEDGGKEKWSGEEWWKNETERRGEERRMG